MTRGCAKVHDGLGARQPLWVIVAHCVDEGRSCTILKFPNATFCNTGLEVGVDDTKGDSLALVGRVLHKDVLAEAAVVGMMVKNLDAHRASVPTKGLLGHVGLLSSIQFLQIYETEAAEMVDKDGRDVVALDCGPSLDSPDEARNG
jgi:hypothetical protein